MKKYYEINEDLARLSNQSNSFTEYVEGSATKYYQSDVNNAYDLANEVLEENKEKALYYADMYAKKLANNINRTFSISCSCPSIMIAGGGNFPVRKKEKQTQRYASAFEEYKTIQGYLEKIKNLKYHKINKEKQGTAKDIDLSNEYFEVIQNEELNRLQLSFNDKPNEEKRSILKKNGFKWSPKNSLWQRQLTSNALCSAKLVIKLFDEL